MVSALLSRCLILFLGTLYPAYRSYKTIKNKDAHEYVKWMMYWIVFALFTTLETFLDIFFSWFPFYYEIKIVFILWVLSPATRGSSLLYKKLVHPMLISREKEIDELIEKTKQQGYTTFLQLFSSGFQYAQNLFITSALKGQLLLGNQLKKSLSMNDVYESSKSSNTNNSIQYNQNGAETYYKKHDTINEDEENSDYENDRKIRRPNKVNQEAVIKTTRVIKKSLSNPHDAGNNMSTSSSSGSNHTSDDLLIDEDLSITDIKKPITKRRVITSKPSSNSNISTSNYRSSEVSHFGTITRGKMTVGKNKVQTTSTSLTAQTIYDNDN